MDARTVTAMTDLNEKSVAPVPLVLGVGARAQMFDRSDRRAVLAVAPIAVTPVLVPRAATETFARIAVTHDPVLARPELADLAGNVQRDVVALSTLIAPSARVVHCHPVRVVILEHE